MRRLFVPMLGLWLLVGAGCFHQRPPTPAEQARAERLQISREIAEDEQRLRGEDSSEARKKRSVIFGVDVAGLGFFQATWRVISEGPERIYDKFVGNTPGRYAREMETADDPDAQRDGILKLAGYSFGRKPPYTTRYEQIAQGPDTEDFTVRAGAIRALNRARDAHATPIFVHYLDDKQWLVRLESAKALANIPDDRAVSVLIRHLNDDDNKDVRIACADALRDYRTPETARALVGALGTREFSVVWQARVSLIIMTGQDFRYDDASWLKYFNESPKPFLNEHA